MKTFRDAIREQGFVIIAECFLKPETDAESICYQADLLRDHVDGVVLTDNQYGQIHMSTVAAARLLLDNDLDPIVQLGCRNRNRIALLADLMGAAALGVSSFLLVHGKQVPKAIKPRPKAVLDMTATELIETAARLKKDKQLRYVPDLFIGSTISPHAPKSELNLEKIVEKADAGAQFLLTNTIMDIEMLRGYMKHLVSAKITRNVSVIVSTAIMASADDATWMRDNRPNVMIPDALIQRLRESGNPQQEGIAICAEQLAQLATIPGVSGANVVASTDLAVIPEAVEAANVRKG